MASKQPSSSRAEKIAAAAPKKSKATPVIAAVIVVAVVAGVAWAIFAGMKSNSSDSSASYPTPKGVEGPAGGVVVNADKVNPKAPTLEIYEDPQCPACAFAEKALGPAVAQIRDAGSAKVTYHVKTFLDDNLRNDSSKRAGNALMCSVDAGKFVQYHDTLFAEKNRPVEEGQGWTDAQLQQYATDSGISGNELQTWKSCFSDDRYGKYLKAVEERTSRDDKIAGTPTYRLNGKDFELKQTTTGEDLINAVTAAGGKPAGTKPTN
ncbi:DsbA family protein [Dermatophilus congolensis]|uniref:Protein-disulfide isomerase n=1 Tax=Dermatophilus congolensis TaxID=1863 RepID=A0A239VNT7_9MICO|nr:thioredoxin domain-containing protein [Dermatophilus congolensis]MBO3129522.1 thioredoxin domain-containing protein [Dermatophilus congolensis]MBO3131845.1 thioredoxin domain-containing protein [Dermatophilus congolensis]MBO3133998.1 thioredoxin domain-containing protein [Dermatophilus congolensis]MBO3136229.1 thioredoxin domain-containing protein [Dermatophilus congolensis]MBO3138475.1 thioredoxin domain-containing protein [Dermatophilus congolensis]